MRKHQSRKRFSQNFLIDTLVVQRIIKAFNPHKNDCVVEIGPGQGALTTELLSKLNLLYAIEIDDNLVADLTALNAHNLTIYHQNVLKFDFTKLPNPIRIISNLPYNISSDILLKIIDISPNVVDAILMLQKEVVERITANPNSKNYGRLSVMLQAFFECEYLFDISNKSFLPTPAVNSALIYLKPHQKQLITDRSSFEFIVKNAFSTRRKKLRNCLKSILKDCQTSIDLDKRAENLSLMEFIIMSQDYKNTLTK